MPEYQITLLARPGRAGEVIDAVDDLGFSGLSPFIIVNETPYVLDVLEAAMDQVEDLAKTEARTELTSLDLDIRTGEILATAATPEEVAAVRVAVASSEEPILARRVVVEQGAVSNLQ